MPSNQERSKLKGSEHTSLVVWTIGTLWAIDTDHWAVFLTFWLLGTDLYTGGGNKKHLDTLYIDIWYPPPALHFLLLQSEQQGGCLLVRDVEARKVTWSAARERVGYHTSDGEVRNVEFTEFSPKTKLETLTVHPIGWMLQGVDWWGGVGARVCSHPEICSCHWRLPRARMVHGRMVTAVVGQRLDFLF